MKQVLVIYFVTNVKGLCIEW